MRSLCTDRLTSALRLISSYGSYGMREILDDRPPIFDYLLSAHLIEAVHSDPNWPDKLYWVLTDAGKDELKRINSRAKRHIALVGFLAFSVVPFCSRLCIGLNIQSSLAGYVISVAITIGMLGLLSFINLVESYLTDHNKFVSGKRYLLLCVLVLAIVFLSAFLFVGPFTKNPS